VIRSLPGGAGTESFGQKAGSAKPTNGSVINWSRNRGSNQPTPVPMCANRVLRMANVDEEWMKHKFDEELECSFSVSRRAPASDSSITLRTYAHVMSYEESAAERLGALLQIDSASSSGRLHCLVHGFVWRSKVPRGGRTNSTGLRAKCLEGFDRFMEALKRAHIVQRQQEAKEISGFIKQLMCNKAKQSESAAEDSEWR
jgi:hypothetical protein